MSALEAQLRQLGLGQNWQLRALGGGCIGHSYCAVNESQQPFFIKSHPHPPTEFFETEAAELEALARSQTLAVPELIAVTPSLLVLQWIDPVSPCAIHWETLGHGLAQLHLNSQPHFGFTADGYCGLTRQPNPVCENGFDFFAHHRLGFQAELALNNGLIDGQLCRRIERLGQNLSQWIPEQQPSLLHGDLWSGNLLFGKQQTFVIDPAAYYGWPEADLAMTELFGHFDARFYATYLEVNPRLPGWSERKPLYNLYHLLNHLNLFGRGYLNEVEAIIDRYI